MAELERAERALAMVDHGATILAQVRRRGRELEAQTSIKRGYLNLIHAREAIARHAARGRGPRGPHRRAGPAETRRRPGTNDASLTTPCSGILVAHHKW